MKLTYLIEQTSEEISFSVSIDRCIASELGGSARRTPIPNDLSNQIG